MSTIEITKVEITVYDIKVYKMYTCIWHDIKCSILSNQVNYAQVVINFILKVARQSSVVQWSKVTLMFIQLGVHGLNQSWSWSWMLWSCPQASTPVMVLSCWSRYNGQQVTVSQQQSLHENKKLPPQVSLHVSWTSRPGWRLADSDWTTPRLRLCGSQQLAKVNISEVPVASTPIQRLTDSTWP